MRSFFKSAVLVWAAASLWLGGCQSGPPPQVASESKVYTIRGHKVAMTPPKDWNSREEEVTVDQPPVKPSATPMGTPTPLPKEVAAVVFEPKTGYGHIAVMVTDGMPQTKDLMNQFANGVNARNGKIIKQWYEHKLNEPDKENAYHMEFELKDAGPLHPVQKGMQVQIFTQKKVLYSLVFTADPEVYDQHRATFLALVKSFELAQ